ncbi:hypothetical protein ASG43_01515 [Aureimonas sp. Leaf454]|uniref:TrmH family RNA methyltransferase n=1 Tax=Aureimonas sp. Leaf454 TaxID=1736381 RepID=UPI0006FB202C|nr:RNA methyltransferase [Aureimonas sp. Leaf454]KQT54316.1 hypothetical protein ASG43_01515 [Aureimonas sp. Leaf454]
MDRYIVVEQPTDDRIEAFRDIRERDLAGRGGLIAEGTVVVEQLLRSPFFEANALLILQNRLAGLEDLLAGVPPSVPVYVADRGVMDAIAGFAIHRGVLAHGRVREAKACPLGEALAALARRGAPVVVAVGIANHDNMGAIFRNAAAFGAGIVLVDATSCNPLYRKAIRVSAGGIFTVPFERFDDPLAIAGMLTAAGFECLALTPGSEQGISDIETDRPVALFLGAEGPGLPNAVIERLRTARIEMDGGYDSLNVATAGAIALHHFTRRRLS